MQLTDQFDIHSNIKEVITVEARRFTKEEVGGRLRFMREKAGFTQEQVAEKLQRAQQTIASWETGNSLPNIIFLFQLCDLYGIDINAAFDLNPAVRKEEEDLRFVNDTWDELSESAKQRLFEIYMDVYSNPANKKAASKDAAC